jgi:hypothetical protein
MVTKAKIPMPTPKMVRAERVFRRQMFRRASFTLSIVPTGKPRVARGLDRERLAGYEKRARSAAEDE